MVCISEAPNHGSSTRKQRKLAIQYESKIDREFNTRGNYKLQPSLRTVAFKWITTLFLGVLILASVSFCKLSVISISERMHDVKTTESDVGKLFVMLQLIAVIPHVISFFRAVFKAAFRSDLLWPSRKSLIAVGISSYLVENKFNIRYNV